LSSYRLGNRPEALLRLLRGGRRIALIMNAADYKPPEERADSLQRELDELRSLGLDVTEVDLRDYFGRPDAMRAALKGVGPPLASQGDGAEGEDAPADSPSSRKPAQSLTQGRPAGSEYAGIPLASQGEGAGGEEAPVPGFDCLYVRGGNVYILRRALRQSGADGLIKDLLAEDALVYAGYSAGPCMLGPTLRGIESEEDDPYFLPERYEAPVVWDGLGVLPYAILPHYDPERPEMQATVEYYIENRVPFVAVRDGEALVIDGDESHVEG
jgi:hypothetical protein